MDAGDDGFRQVSKLTRRAAFGDGAGGAVARAVRPGRGTDVGRPTEEALYDSISMRQFVGIDLGCASGFRTRRQS
jgi:hypothetical protein